MATDQEVNIGLLDWINSLEACAEVSTAEDLNDGQVIWQVLQQIDRFSFPGSLPEATDNDEWVARWTNLKHVYDALSLVLVEECGQRIPMLGGHPDLRAIAQSAALRDINHLLKLVVIVAINCSDRVRYLQGMQDLSESTQQVLMATVQEVADDDENTTQEEMNQVPAEASSSPSTPASPRVRVDNALASEERLSKVIADNQRIALEKRDLQRQLEELQNRHVQLQQSQDRTKDELKETSDRLRAVLGGKADGSGAKSSDPGNETVIEGLEERLASSEQQVESLRKSNEVFRIKADRAQTLQDEYDEIKIERDRLSRKANAADKYKLKLEAGQELEKENTTLRAKVADLQTQLKESDSGKVSKSELQREIEEYRRLLPSIEQERHELNEIKKRLDFDYHTLEARYNDTVEQFQRQKAANEELRTRLQDYEDGLTPSTPITKYDADIHNPDHDLPVTEPEALNPSAPTSPFPKESEVDSETTITEFELQSIMSAMRAQASAATSSAEKAAVEETQKKLLARLTNVEPSTTTITFDDALGVREPEIVAGAAAEPKASGGDDEDEMEGTHRKLEEALNEIENLKRELNLMTGAWYDQQIRMMSNYGFGQGFFGASESLDRGADFGPKSFLRRQRRIVDEVVLGVGSGVRGAR